MIKFFRRIRKSLLAENRFSKYLIYAIGEIVLVVIGILIALQVNNLNENRKQDRRVKAFLTKLKEQVDKNKETTKDYIAENQEFVAASMRLMSLIGKEQNKNIDAELDTLLLYNTLDFYLNLDLIVLEEARNNGDLAAIKSDSLRQSLYTFIKLYDQYLEREKVTNEDLSINLKPYMNKHYNMRNLINRYGNAYGILDFKASPLYKDDNTSILNDQEFENMIVTRILFNQDMVMGTEELHESLNTIDRQLTAAIQEYHD